MAKTEDFRPLSADTQDTAARDALIDAAFSKPSVTRAGDQQRGGVVNTWQPVNPETWSKTNGSDSPTGPNGVQWNGGRPDVSRGPGGTVYQPRPQIERQPAFPYQRQNEAPGIAPVLVPAVRDQTGKYVGPTILPDVPQYQAPPEKKPSGGLIERGDGTLMDTRSERDKGRAELDLAGFVIGGFVGLVKGGLKGGIAGGIIGVVAAELLKPLNPFHK